MVKRDFTRLTPDEKINGIKASKLPDYIRSKYHGEDVREAIAQSTEVAIQLGIDMGLSPEDALSWARKLQDIDVDVEAISTNLFNKDDIIKDGYYDYDGTWRKAVNYVHSSNFIPVKPSTKYKRTGTTTAIMWDKNKKLTSGSGNSVFTTTNDTAYVTISFLVDTEADVKLMESKDWTDDYVPYKAGYTLGESWKVEVKNLSLPDGSISPTKLDDVKLEATSTSKNLFNKDDIIKGGYYDYDGTWRKAVNYVHSSNFIPVKPGTKYKRTGITTGILWDKNKKLISGFGDSVFSTTNDTAYVTISFLVDTEAVVKLMEYKDWTDDYVPYKKGYTLGESWKVEAKNLSLSDGSILPTKLDDVKLEATSTSKNLFNKDDIIKGGYYDYNGKWKADNYVHSSNFIPVKPGTQYQRTGTTTGILWDKNKKLISGFGDSVFSTTNDTAYVTISFLVDTEAVVKLMEYNDWTDDYVPYKESYTLGESWQVEGKNLSLSDGSILPTKLDDVKLEVTSKNLFNKDDIIKGGYYDYNGTWKRAINYVHSSNFIPVKPSTKYKRTGTTTAIMWDKNKKLTSGSGNSVFMTTADTAYVTISFLVDTEADVKLMEYKDWTDDYVPFESKYTMGEKWLNRTPSKETFSAFLRVPTPYVDGTDDPWSEHQTTHPSIVQFDEEWNGYKYWLAHTPFPHTQDKYENPCIAVSNNGVKWEEPTGVTNPLVPKPNNQVFHEYNSDTCILYNDTNDEIEIWYREVIRKKEPREERENLKRITSSDGTNWSEPELMLSHSDPTSLAGLISPSVIYHEGVYKLWVMNNSKIVFMTSTDGKEWSEKVEVLTNGESFTTWHPNVVLYNDEFHMFNTIYAGPVKYSTASLGSETSFSDEKTIISPTGNEWDLDGHRLYRAAPIFHENSVMVIHGMVSYGTDYTLGLVSGLDVYHLETVPQKAYEFYGVEWWE